MPCGLGSEDLGKLNWEASHLPVLQTDIPVPIESAGAAGEGWPQGV